MILLRLAQVPLLGPLEAGARSRLVDALEEVRYDKGDAIISEGEPGTHFYLVMQGSVSVTKQGRGEIATRGVGDYLGERSLQRALPTSASVVAATACRVMRMDKATFERLLGPVLLQVITPSPSHTGRSPTRPRDHTPPTPARRHVTSPQTQEAAQPLLRRYESSTADEILAPLAALGGSAADAAAAAMRLPEHEFDRASGTVRLSDFTVAEEELGAGGFGRVRCCCHKGSETLYAMKHMHKKGVARAARRVVQESQVVLPPLALGARRPRDQTPPTTGRPHATTPPSPNSNAGALVGGAAPLPRQQVRVAADHRSPRARARALPQRRPLRPHSEAAAGAQTSFLHALTQTLSVIDDDRYDDDHHHRCLRASL